MTIVQLLICRKLGIVSYHGGSLLSARAIVVLEWVEITLSRYRKYPNYFEVLEQPKEQNLPNRILQCYSGASLY